VSEPDPTKTLSEILILAGRILKASAPLDEEGRLMASKVVELHCALSVGGPLPDPWVR
jgi:hypothetical protein